LKWKVAAVALWVSDHADRAADPDAEGAVVQANYEQTVKKIALRCSVMVTGKRWRPRRW